MNQLRELNITEKVNKYIRGLSNVNSNNYLNIVNHEISNEFNNSFNINMMKKIFYHNKNLLNREDTNEIKIRKLVFVFLQLHQHFKKYVDIEQKVDLYDNNLLYISLKMNNDALMTLFSISLKSKTIYIDVILHNTGIKGMIYYTFLYINYILAILTNYDIPLMKSYDIGLNAAPNMAQMLKPIVPINPSTPITQVNQRLNFNQESNRLYSYYESFGFEPINKQIRNNRKTAKIGKYRHIDYATNYTVFITDVYNNIIKMIINYSKSIGSSASNSTASVSNFTASSSSNSSGSNTNK
jgi:hypothetical protein